MIALLRANANVSVPILPTNMEKMITSLPGSDNCEVIPVLNPTVEKAETSSKIISINRMLPSSKAADSVILSTKTETNRQGKAIFLLSS